MVLLVCIVVQHLSRKIMNLTICPCIIIIIVVVNVVVLIRVLVGYISVGQMDIT